jgi:hypothetical protein
LWRRHKKQEAAQDGRKGTAVQMTDWREGGERRAQTAITTGSRSRFARNKTLCGFQASAGGLICSPRLILPTSKKTKKVKTDTKKKKKNREVVIVALAFLLPFSSLGQHTGLRFLIY